MMPFFKRWVLNEIYTFEKGILVKHINLSFLIWVLNQYPQYLLYVAIIRDLIIIYIYKKNSLSPQAKKYKVYNCDDFLKTLYKHGLIYYKAENENSSI